jgi:hypothetical protein
VKIKVYHFHELPQKNVLLQIHWVHEMNYLEAAIEEDGNLAQVGSYICEEDKSVSRCDRTESHHPGIETGHQPDDPFSKR